MLLLEVWRVAILGVLTAEAALWGFVSGVVSICLFLFSFTRSYSSRSDILKLMRLNFWLSILT